MQWLKKDRSNGYVLVMQGLKNAGCDTASEKKVNGYVQSQCRREREAEAMTVFRRYDAVTN